MTNSEILQILQDTGAIVHGHFALTSGRHSNTYCQCARVLEQPNTALTLAKEVVRRLPADLRRDIGQVAAPAIGGLLFGFAVAAALNKPFIFSERKNGEMLLRRSFEVSQQAPILVCEDVVTTGGSVKELLTLIEQAGGSAGGVATLIDRGSQPDFGVSYYPLIKLNVPSWTPENCQLCADGVSASQPGSRAS